MLLICCFALEVALRIIYARSLDFSMEMWKYATLLKHPVSDGQLRFVHTPNRAAFLMGVPVSINSHGYRDREYSVEKPVGAYRVMMLGDSTTFGWGVSIENTAAKILEGELNRAAVPGRRFEVINAGVGNFNTVQEFTHYITYDRIFHPDLVILVYFINDAETIPSAEVLPWVGRSYAWAFLASRFDAVMRMIGKRPDWKTYYSDLYQDDRPAFQEAKNALIKLARSTQDDGAKLMVAILPELREINASYPFDAAHKKIKDLLVQNNVRVIDLIDGLRGRVPESQLWVTPQDDHPNARANALVAAQILPWVLQDANGSNHR